MRKMRKSSVLPLVGLVILTVAGLGMCGLVVHDRFCYIDATDMRLFVMRWPWYVGGFVAMLAGMVIVEELW